MNIKCNPFLPSSLSSCSLLPHLAFEASVFKLLQIKAVAGDDRWLTSLEAYRCFCWVSQEQRANSSQTQGKSCRRLCQSWEEGNSSRKTEGSGGGTKSVLCTPAATQVCTKRGLRATLTCARCWDLYVSGVRLRELQAALWRPSSPPLAKKFKRDSFQSLCWPSAGVENHHLCFLGALKLDPTFPGGSS